VGPVHVAVYNHFYSLASGEEIEGFWATDTMTGTESCALEGGPIVV
jgi:hypothetical protein